MLQSSKLFRAAFLSFIFIFIFISPVAANHIPAPSGHVNDFAGVLTTEQKTTLENDLAAYEQQTNNEVAVAFIKSLEGGDIDDFTVRVFEEWKIGKDDKDNGILFLAAIEDHKMRIEVGYGLEPYLTDSEAGSIIRDTIAPQFKQEKYFEGISQGIAKIEEELNSGQPENKEPFPILSMFKATIFLLVILLYLVSYMGRTSSIWLGGIVGAILGLVVGWIVYSLAIAIISAGILGGLGLILDWILTNVYKTRKAQGKSVDWFHARGGFWSGGGSGSRFGGFGGGSSGGGGASGRW